MDAALGQSLSPEMSNEAEAELEAMEADYAELEAVEQLPSVPKVQFLGSLVAVTAACMLVVRINSTSHGNLHSRMSSARPVRVQGALVHIYQIDSSCS